MKTNRVIMTESTKTFITTELGVDVENLSEEDLLKELRSNKKVVVTLQENGTFKVKQVLNG